MDCEAVSSKLKGKLEPHIRAVMNGEPSEYDILPTILALLLEKQETLDRQQLGLSDLDKENARELKVLLDAHHNESLSKSNAIDDFMSELSRLQTQTLASLVDAKTERKKMRILMIVNLALSIISLSSLVGALFILLKQ